MAIEEPLKGWFDDIREDVANVDGYSVQLLYRNTENNLENIIGYVANPSEINEEISALLKAVLAFATIYQQNRLVGDAGLPRIALARIAVLDAHDALGTTLAMTKLSGKPRSLGL